MSLRSYSAKRDKNEAAIVDALEAIGVNVQRISVKDFADLICFHPHEGLRLIEVKNEHGKNKVSAGQIQNHRVWPVSVVRTEAEALALFGVRGESPK